MGLYTKQDEIINIIKVLRGELEVLSSRLKPHGTGYIYTALDVIQSRIDELIEEVTAPYWKDEDGDIGRLPGQTKASHLRSVEGALERAEADDGYEEHTEAMELARLREIQDKAAGRKPNTVRDAYLHSTKDDYEHTDEYYDTQRNKPMEGENLPITEGLSNRSMKQRYGQAIQTTSEMMQEELEPLPINTFK